MAVSSGSAVTDAPQLLVDGGFEQANVRAGTWSHFSEVGGWKSDTGVEVWGKNFYNVKATEGDKVAELDFDNRRSNLYQDVKTEAGVEYEFSFDFAKRSDSKAGSDTIEIFWNGEKIASVEPTSTAWNKAEFKVTGTGGSDRIEFREQASDNDSYGGLIDNASLKSTGRVEKEAAERVAAEAETLSNGKTRDGDHNDDGHDDNGVGNGGKDKDKGKDAAEKALLRRRRRLEGCGSRRWEDRRRPGREKAAAAADHDDTLIGTGRVDKLEGDEHANLMFGEGGTDVLVGGGGGDRMHGGGGDDTMSGDEGNDLMFGASTLGGKVDMSKFRVAEDATAKVTFDSESAGYKNALGAYKIAADGTISGVRILFANASLKGSGGDLVAGRSSVDLAIKAGEQLGFFVVPDGYSQYGMAKLLSDASATFKFVGANGKPGNINAGSELKLVQVNASGVETVVKSAYGSAVFHSVDDGTMGLNGDKLKHVTATVDNLDGTVKIGFEDLKGGGDKDFDDSVFTVTLGATNTALLAKETTMATRAPDKDVMTGGDGDDKMFGMADDDTMDGGDGKDQMWGNSGNDVMNGGAGDDQVRGGKGDDVLVGGEGDDVVEGNSGDDVMFDGKGSDSYNGGAGFDTLDFSLAASGMIIDVSKGVATNAGGEKNAMKSVERVVGSAFADTYKGSKNGDVFEGGDGDDVIRGMGGSDKLTGGAGRDSFVWLAKDLGAGVDHITDFSKHDVLDLHELLKGQKYASTRRCREGERRHGRHHRLGQDGRCDGGCRDARRRARARPAVQRTYPELTLG